MTPGPDCQAPTCYGPNETRMCTLARRCIPLRFGASRSDGIRRGGRQGTCTMRVLAISQFAQLRIGIPLDYSIVHGPESMPPAYAAPKFGRLHPTTAAAAPATFRFLQIAGRERMAITADIGYGHGLGDTFQGKAHHLSFGCFKARPRYHLQRFAPSCNGLPRVCSCSQPALRRSRPAHCSLLNSFPRPNPRTAARGYLSVSVRRVLISVVRAEAARHSLISAFQSLGGWPPASILEKTRYASSLAP